MSAPEVVCSACPFVSCPDCPYQAVCEACGDDTGDPDICEHVALCTSCAEEGCRRCQNEARYETRLGL